MFAPRSTEQRAHRSTGDLRGGNILVLTAGALVMVFAFVAFTVDVGYVTLTKAELQNTSDAAALASALELHDGMGPGALVNWPTAETLARQAAQDVAAANRGGGLSSVYVDQTRDVRFGQYQYDAASDSWVKAWGVTPYNLVEVTARRDQADSSSGDAPLDLFFAPVIGHDQADVRTISTAALFPGVGFSKRPGQNVSILPITLDEDTWNDLLANPGNHPDDYTYNPSDGTVTPGGDGIHEVNLYPEGNQILPPGNRGTVDFGHQGNSTADITRQILYGLNDDDWAALASQGITELRWDTDPLFINGDTGLSAGIKDELEAIKGLPRAIPIFREVSGPGNNATYTIVRFVGVRIVYVKLTGKPSGKRVMIQPAPFSDFAVIPGEEPIDDDTTIFAPAALVP